MDNHQIAQYLREQRDNSIADFRALPSVHARFEECFTILMAFDFAAYRQQLHIEIQHHLIHWQSKNDTQGAPLDALLFEFNSIYEWAVEACAYGIVDWMRTEEETVKGFDMGFKFDFRNGFENVPGISLSFLQPLEDLLNPDTIHELTEPEQDVEDVPGFRNLADAYLFSGLVVVHEVLAALQQQKAFTRIELKPAALFLLGGHDTGLVYPILATSSN